jgi:hypothetical protein
MVQVCCLGFQPYNGLDSLNNTFSLGFHGPVLPSVLQMGIDVTRQYGVLALGTYNDSRYWEMDEWLHYIDMGLTLGLGILEILTSF